jgi:hypothetical protein
MWKIPMTADDAFNLFFVEFADHLHAHGADVNLEKELAVVSSVSTIWVRVSDVRLLEDFDDIVGLVESALKLQCPKINRSSNTETSSAVAVMCREVGLPGQAPTSLEETERRRHDQDRDGFERILSGLQQRGLNPTNLLVLRQPCVGCFRGLPFAPESYKESLRDFARFIEAVCRTKRSLGFAGTNSVLAHVAGITDRFPSPSAMDAHEASDNVVNEVDD